MQQVLKGKPCFPHFTKGTCFILPLYHKNLKGHTILNVLRSFFRAINTPSIIQLWLFICLFLRTYIWSSCFPGNWVLQDIITAIQRVNETMHCRQSWWPGKPEKVFKMLWHKVLLLKRGNQSSPMNNSIDYGWHACLFKNKRATLSSSPCQWSLQFHWQP